MRSSERFGADDVGELAVLRPRAVEDSFLEHGEEPGVWVGSGSAALGLSGVVEEGQLARLFDEGRHPVTGEPLGFPYRHDSKRTVVTGFALSFSPPKSVSLVARSAGAGWPGRCVPPMTRPWLPP